MKPTIQNTNQQNRPTHTHTKIKRDSRTGLRKQVGIPTRKSLT